MNDNPGEDRKLNDRKRAFELYKERTKLHGKPFFPFGIWHDVVMSAVVIFLIIAASWLWFAQANCGSVWDVWCPQAATPEQQEEHHGLLGHLYEHKADPATTSYHPRPEWYFYFLFYLLIVFSHPQSVLMGTIGLPTIALVLLLLWPFIDRKRERRPSRRPVAMVGMVATAVILLAFTWLGSQAGVHTGPEGITEAQQEMPGFALLFDDERGAQCLSCHTIAGSGNDGPGPVLTNQAERNRGVEWQIDWLRDPQAIQPGVGMPPFGDVFTEEELAQLATFLETLGAPDRAESPEYTNWEQYVEEGGGKGADAKASDGLGNGGEGPAPGSAETPGPAAETAH